MDGARAAPSGLRVRPLVLLLSAAGLVGVVLAGCALGSVDLGLAQVWAALWGDAGPRETAIVRELRLPRVLMGVVVGTSLATSGAALQGLFRNPLADPYIIGVSAGAALGAATALVFAEGAWVPIAAALGGFVSALVVHTMARAAGSLALGAVLLAGVAVGACCQALLSLVVLLAEARAGEVVLWLMGHLGGSTWDELGWVALIATGGCLLLAAHARTLDALSLGEESAAALGVEVERAKLGLLGATALLVAASVAFCGLIGFVGLIVPHVARLLVGPAHRWLLPASALLGALTLVLADLGARTLVEGRELPVGVITGALGGPFFLAMLRSRLSATRL